MDNERLQQVEIKLAYLEDEEAKLNEVVTEQDRTIEHLQQYCEDLKVRLSELEEPRVSQRPPHY